MLTTLRRRITHCMIAAGSISIASVAAPVEALSSSYGTTTCVVNPLRPILKDGSVTTSFSVSCNKIASIKVEVAVGEWDGSTFELPSISTVALMPKVLSITATTQSTVITTTPKACWNSEIGNEEYGTRVRLYIGGRTWSSAERTSGPVDFYSC